MGRGRGGKRDREEAGKQVRKGTEMSRKWGKDGKGQWSEKGGR